MFKQIMVLSVFEHNWPFADLCRAVPHWSPHIKAPRLNTQVSMHLPELFLRVVRT